jgi:lysozyme
MKKVLVISAPSFVLFLALMTWGYVSGYWRFNYPDKERYPIHGIDVSHHQGVIDWEKVQGQGVHFVYMKATEGSDHKDKAFLSNWKEASRIGLTKGAYHFFTFCKGGIEQANNFIKTVPVESNTLPPAIDVEFAGNCKTRPKKEDIVKELFSFIREIEKRYDTSPIFYVTYESYEYYLKGEFNSYTVWIRDIYRRPRFPDGEQWSFWQYADRGRVDGIRGPVDLNVFNGSVQEFFTVVQQRRADTTCQRKR